MSSKLTPLGILFVDLSGYTALTDIHGGHTAFKTIEVFQQIASKSLTGEAMIKERIGDELLIISAKPLDLLVTILKISRMAEQTSKFLKIKAGMHYGKLLVKGGKLFGATINLAARIIAIAKTDQILCSDDFLNSLPKSEKSLFKKLSNYKFKNIREPIAIFELQSRSNNDDHDNTVDPVCKMILLPSNETISQEHFGKRYYFCSPKCKRLFLQNPLSFINTDTEG